MRHFSDWKPNTKLPDIPYTICSIIKDNQQLFLQIKAENTQEFQSVSYSLKAIQNWNLSQQFIHRTMLATYLVGSFIIYSEIQLFHDFRKPGSFYNAEFWRIGYGSFKNCNQHQFYRKRTGSHPRSTPTKNEKRDFVKGDLGCNVLRQASAHTMLFLFK